MEKWEKTRMRLVEPTLFPTEGNMPANDNDLLVSVKTEKVTLNSLSIMKSSPEVI